MSVEPLRNAVCVVILRDDGRLLFAQRPEQDSYPGYWNPVTGGCEETDGTDFHATCVREAREEVGLEIEVLGKLWESSTERANFRLHWFLARCLNGYETILDPNEVSAVRWVSLDEIAHIKPSFADTRRFFRELWEPAYAKIMREAAQ